MKTQFIYYHSTITRWFKKFCSGCKNLNNQARLGSPKDRFQFHAPSHSSKSLGVAPREYQVRLASHCPLWFMILAKASRAATFYLAIKILQCFWLTLVKKEWFLERITVFLMTIWCLPIDSCLSPKNIIDFTSIWRVAKRNNYLLCI